MEEEYAKQIYDYIVSNDSTYANDVSYDAFKESVRDGDYALKIKEYVSGFDPSFSEVDDNEFVSSLGGGEPVGKPQASEEVSQVSSEESTVGTESTLPSQLFSGRAGIADALAQVSKKRQEASKEPQARTSEYWGGVAEDVAASKEPVDLIQSEEVSAPEQEMLNYLNEEGGEQFALNNPYTTDENLKLQDKYIKEATQKRDMLQNQYNESYDPLIKAEIDEIDKNIDDVLKVNLEAKDSNSNIFARVQGRRYFDKENNELSRSQMRDYLTSTEFVDKLRDGEKLGLKIQNDPDLKALYDYQLEGAEQGWFQRTGRGTTANALDIAMSLAAKPTAALLPDGVVPMSYEDKVLGIMRVGKEVSNDVRGARMIEPDPLQKIQEGNVWSGTKDAVQMGIESLPYTGVAAIPYLGMPLLFDASSTQKYAELREQGVSKEDALVAAGITGAVNVAEGAVELGILKDIARKTKGFTPDAVKQVGVNSLKNIPKDVITEFGQGTIESAATQNAIYGRYDIGVAMRDGAIEAMSSAPISSASGVTAANRILFSKSIAEKNYNNGIEAVSDLMGKAELEGNKEKRDNLIKSARSLVSDISADVDAANESASKATSEEKQELLDITKKINDFEKSLMDELPQKAKETIENNVEGLQKEKDDIINEIDKREEEVESFFDGQDVLFKKEDGSSDNVGRGKVVDGKINIEGNDGDSFVFDTPSMEVVNISENEEGTINVTLKDRYGNEVTIQGDKAYDVALRYKENKVGVVPKQVFEETIQEFEEEYVKSRKDAVQEQETEGVPVREQAQPSEEVVEEVREEIKENEQEEVDLRSAFDKSADSALAWIEQQEKDLKKFSEGTLGMNLPVAVAQSALTAAKSAIKAAKTINQAIKAAKKAVEESDWYKGLSEKGQAEAIQATKAMFGRKTKIPARKIEQETKGLTDKERTKQGFEEYTSAKKEEAKNKLDEATTKLKEKYNAAKEKAKTKRESNKAAQILLVDYIKEKARELGLNDFTRSEMLSAARGAKNVTEKTLNNYIKKFDELAKSKDEKRTWNKAIKEAKEIKNKRAGKFGNMSGKAKALASINPFDIPKNRFKEYARLLGEMNKANPSVESLNAMSDFITKINKEVEAKVLGNEGYASMMKEAGTTGKGDTSDWMRDNGYSDNMIDYFESNFKAIKDAYNSLYKEGKTQEEKDAALEKRKEKKEELLEDAKEAIKDNKYKSGVYESVDEMQIAKDILGIKEKNLKDLSIKDLAMLPTILNNASNGMISNETKKLLDKIKATESFQEVENNTNLFKRRVNNGIEAVKNAVGETKRRLENADNITDADKILKQMMNKSANNIEKVFKGVEENVVYRKLIAPLTQGLDSATTTSNKIKNEVEELFKGIKGDKYFANTLMGVYLRAREEKANPDNSVVKPAIDYVEATIGNTGSNYANNVLSSIAKEYFNEDGTPNIQKMEADLKKANAMPVVDYMDNYFKENEDKTRYISEILRGKPFEKINSYAPRSTIKGSKTSEDNFVNRVVNPSTKSGNVEDRTSNVEALNFNAIDNFISAMTGLEIDYHVTPAMMEVNSLLDLMESTGNGDTRNIAKAFKNKNKNLIARTYQREVQPRGLGRIVMDKFKSAYTSSILSGAVKFMSEAPTQYLKAKSIASNQLKKGSELMKEVTKDSSYTLKDFLQRLGSTQSDRAGTYTDEVLDRTSTFNKRVRRGDSGRFTKLAAYIERSGFSSFVNESAKLAQVPIRKPDSFTVTPVVLGEIALEYEKATGEKFTKDTMDKIMFDNEFFTDNKKVLKSGTSKGDILGSRVGNIGSVSEKRQDLIGNKAAFNEFNQYMRSFSGNEAEVFQEAAATLIKGAENTSLDSKKQAMRIIAGQLIQQAGYVAIRQGLFALIGSMLGDDDELDLSKIGNKTLADIILINALGNKGQIAHLLGGFVINQIIEGMGGEPPVYVTDPTEYGKPTRVLRSYGGATGGVLANFIDVGSNISKGEVKPSDALVLMSTISAFPFYQDVSKIIRTLEKQNKTKHKNKKRSTRKSKEINVEDINIDDFDI